MIERDGKFSKTGNKISSHTACLLKKALFGYINVTNRFMVILVIG